jgi:uncharacterized OsmC-like protein
MTHEEKLRELSERAEEECPVSQALGGTTIEINARLVGAAAKS